MPDLDLGPNDYRKQDPKTGAWHVPDDPKLARLMFFVMVFGLGYVFWNRDTLSQELIFGGAALAAFVAGIMLNIWLKDRY